MCKEHSCPKMTHVVFWYTFLSLLRKDVASCKISPSHLILVP